MKRRTFVRTTTAAAAGMLAGPLAAQGRSGRMTGGRRAELLLRGGTIIDGTGETRVQADVRISGDRIIAIGRNLDEAGAEVIDVRERIVAPGFIDIHSHTDTVLLSHPRAESKIRQGVTTEIAGQDGSSVAPSSPDRVQQLRERFGDDVDVTNLREFFRTVETRGAAVNLGSMVGAGTVRGLVIGNDDRPATSAEISRMQELVRGAWNHGACGLSSGLEYTPGGFADRNELVALAQMLRGTGLPYASHMRNEDDALVAAIEEALFVGRVAGVPVQISHLKVQGQRNWWKIDVVLDMIETARTSGVDVHFDRYPYIAYATGLSNLFPLWSRDGGTDAFLTRLDDAALLSRIEAAVRDKIAQLGSWDSVQISSTAEESLAWARGARLGTLASERGTEPWTLLLTLMREDRARTGMVGFGMSEDNTARILAHRLGMICSDGSALATEGPLATGSPHPRNFGSFPRVLGHHVRDQGTMSLEQAVHKMTGMPAGKLKLVDRGLLIADAFADIVVFDADTIADRATFEQPFAYPTGIDHVIVNGEVVIREGEHTGATPGRIVVAGR